MDLKNAKRASELLKEIENISEYERIIKAQYSHTAHFELCQHFGNDPDKVVLDRRHTKRFLVVVEEIIKELNDELSKL